MSDDSPPDGWSLVTVGDVATYINGRAFKPAEWEDSGRPIIRIQNLTRSTAPFNYTTKSVDGKFVVAPGTLLVSWSATLDVFVWKGSEAVLNQHIFKVVPRESLAERRFLRWGLVNAIREMRASEHTHGTTMRHINRGPFLAHPFPLAPLREQRRIVEAIEEQFSRLDAGVESLQRAKRNLARLRASVLQAAVEGRLVPQDPDDEPARKLLLRLLGDREAAWRCAKRAAKYKPPSPPVSTELVVKDGWEAPSLEAVTDPARVICYGILKPKTSGDLAVPYVEVRDIDEGRIDVANLKRTTVAMHEQFPRSVLAGGDVLLAVRGSFDRAAVVPAELAGANISRDVARLAPLSGVLPEYVALFLMSPPALRHLRSVARGVGVRGVNIGSVRETPIPLPPTAEQVRIVAEVDRRFSIFDAMEQAIEDGLKRAGGLRQAILREAFAGRLVPQDPFDEPASALLERIRAERA